MQWWGIIVGSLAKFESLPPPPPKKVYNFYDNLLFYREKCIQRIQKEEGFCSTPLYRNFVNALCFLAAAWQLKSFSSDFLQC